jgi:hypothetical protein
VGFPADGSLIFVAAGAGAASASASASERSCSASRASCWARHRSGTLELPGGIVEAGSRLRRGDGLDPRISGRSDLPFAEAMRLDLEYVDHHSARLDLVILARTLGAVLSGQGAC